MAQLTPIASKRGDRVDLATARRIALAAQGFSSGSRPAGREPGLTALTAAVRRLGLLQLDSVNVFCRAHYMPVFSRLGPYDTRLLDRIAGHGSGRVDRRLVEYWAHEASLIPLEHHRLFHWRMDERQRIWGGMRRVLEEQQDLIAETLALVRARGPIRARDTGHQRTQAAPGEMWNWHQGKVALEALFFTGAIGAARRINFERHYDLIERILPQGLLDDIPSRDDAQRELARLAARALGIATLADLADYWRITARDLAPRVAELVGAGELTAVQVAGWESPAYLWHEARRPRALPARALLSPFDPLIFFRPRTERLFDFRYRIEIYTPRPKRVYGYYVLPFLLDERLVARADLKSDRQAGVLRVQGAFAETGVDRVHVARELAAELELCAGWLGLDGGVAVGERGDLNDALRGSLR
ncbi:MAG: YcaQ family DNA glycosylase [Acidobacteriota bacterium]|nr:YcaQ family DNA glycosylase [Acidobacteriota bacterium]